MFSINKLGYALDSSNHKIKGTTANFLAVRPQDVGDTWVKCIPQLINSKQY